MFRGGKVCVRFPDHSLRVVKFLRGNGVLRPQFLVALKIRLRPRVGGFRRVGVGLRLVGGGLGGGHFHGHQIERGERRFVIGFRGVGGRLLLRGDGGVIRRVNLHQRFIGADHFVVKDVNGGNLTGNSRRNGNDVRGNESVVGGFVRQHVHEVAEAEIQQHRERDGGGPDDQRRI